MKAHASVLVLSILTAGCASQHDLWRAQENIVANDNRIAHALSVQHETILSGTDSDLARQIDQLRQQNQAIDQRAREIADQATSARTLAEGALRGLETYVGSLGGPLGGAIGASIHSIAEGVRTQDTRLLTLESETRASSQRVATIESSLDDRIRSELLTLGLTPEQSEALQSGLSPEELVAHLAILGLSTGTGAFASKLGKSRSAPDIETLKRRLETLEHKP